MPPLPAQHDSIEVDFSVFFYSSDRSMPKAIEPSAFL